MCLGSFFYSFPFSPAGIKGTRIKARTHLQKLPVISLHSNPLFPPDLQPCGSYLAVLSHHRGGPAHLTTALLSNAAAGDIEITHTACREVKHVGSINDILTVSALILGD